MNVSRGREGILWTPQDSALPKNFVETGFTLSAGTGLQVAIAAGRCDINGKLFYTASPLYCDVPASSSTKIYLNYTALSFTPIVSINSGDVCLGTIVSGTSSITSVGNTGRRTLGGTLFTPCMPIGMPFPCLTTARPDGTLLCDGSSFDTALYPDLAKVYPSGVLPDLRGVTLRGLDHGRGLDIDGANRALGSYQADQFASHEHHIAIDGTTDYLNTQNGTGQNARWFGSSSNGTGSSATELKAQEAGGTETRGKNVAVDWLVYATLPIYDLNVNNANAATLGGYSPSHFLAEADLKTRLNASGDAPIYACRAWAKISINSGIPSIVESGNVSSVTDLGVGQYQINFATPMVDDNYSIGFGVRSSSDTGSLLTAAFPLNASSCKVNTHGLSSGAAITVDATIVTVEIFR